MQENKVFYLDIYCAKEGNIVLMLLVVLVKYECRICDIENILYLYYLGNIVNY